MAISRILVIPFIACALVSFNSTAATSREAEEAERFPLAKGTYRLAGKCTKLMFLEIDITADCLSYAGILAENPDRPDFLFPRKNNGAWIFKTSSAGIISDGGTATYKVDSVIDIGSQRMSQYSGECMIIPSGEMQGIRCTLWKDQARQITVREAVFSSNGSWIFGKK
ncbi:MAG: hypothetical protein JWR21_2129 [Herminiimonas sp.]|nr:hypothetical protein [Herminiimonas sp.]MDB5854339.1 hypothetical protein [Herminiimonas sp.]